MELPTSKLNGEVAGGVTVADRLFDAPFNEALVHQVVVAYQAGARAGTRAHKNRSAVRGGGTKPWRQKGTGRARAGTIRSPIWRGGGNAFPATTRDFSQKVNRKMYRAAMRAIISELARQNRLLIVDELNLEAPKTKLLVSTLRSLNCPDVLLVGEEFNEVVDMAARNLPWVGYCSADEIDPVGLIRHQSVLMSVAAVKKVEELLQ